MNPRAPSAALTAFLRGVERRGAVFAQWQCGDAATGDMALAATLKAFVAGAGTVAFGEWPQRFWSMLLAAPALRTPPASARWPDALASLATLGTGPRAALLLRLVAGLSEGEGAAVLGVSRPTYRLALQRALPHQADGKADPAQWQALNEAAQQAIRGLPAERLDALTRPSPLRPSRWSAAKARPAAKAATAATPRARWMWPCIVLVALATALLLAATWWMPERFGALVVDEHTPRIQVESLPEAADPAGRYDAETALLTHRDLPLLLDAGTGAAPPDDPAFLAWLTVILETPGALDAASSAIAPPAGETAPETPADSAEPGTEMLDDP